MTVGTTTRWLTGAVLMAAGTAALGQSAAGVGRVPGTGTRRVVAARGTPGHTVTGRGRAWTSAVCRVGVSVTPTMVDCPAGMVEIPGGVFEMGSRAGEGFEDERPQHLVRLGTYCMDTTEVTVAAYRRCVNAEACEPPEVGRYCNWGVGGRDEHPVNCVDWDQSEAYCRWVGGRLPTEAEWEFAARGADGRTYPWGSEEPTGQLCWNHGYDDGTCPVGTYPDGASPFGLMDMAGNLGEWTADWYAPYGRYREEPVVNPTGPEYGTLRVFRGGDWNGYAFVEELRASGRGVLDGASRYNLVGFRCARGTE